MIKIRKQFLWTIYLCLAILGMMLLSGCESSTSQTATTSEAESTENEEESMKLDTVNIEGAVTQLMEKMSLEEKIGQLFIISTDSLDLDSAQEMTDTMKKSLDIYHPGGILFFSYNMKNRDQTFQLIQDLQNASTTPMFMGLDEEGGSVQRLAKVKDMGIDPIPSMNEVGLQGDSSLAYTIGLTIAHNMSQLGFNLDFAPVADICKLEDNTEIGDRSFGDDPKLVSDMVAKEVEGLQENGICATLKHFPGQGAVQEDTHKGYANLDTTIDKLRKREFLPFESGIESDVDFVMVSHISVAPITQNEVPSSLSKLMVQNILREELGFEGVIVTDAMNMKVITKFYDAADAAITAIKAGVDVILMPDDMEEAYNAVLDAVQSGQITEDRIDESVERILRIKLRRGIISLEETVDNE